MAVFLRRFVVSHHSQQLQQSIGNLQLVKNASRRCLSSQGKPPVPPGPTTMNRSGGGFQSFKSRPSRAERARQSNAAGGWLVFGVAMAGGSISAVVMAYTEGAKEVASHVQQLHTTDSSSSSSSSSSSVAQFRDHGGRVRQVDPGDDGKNKTVPTETQQSNLMHLLDFDDYILDNEYELRLPSTAVTRHQLVRPMIQEVETNVALHTIEPGTDAISDISRRLD
jgi:hypothetical protein